MTAILLIVLWTGAFEEREYDTMADCEAAMVVEIERDDVMAVTCVG